MTPAADHATKLTPAEDAYVHLAGFQRGDRVYVDSRMSPRLSGTVTLPQQHDHSDINRAYLTVTSDDGTVMVKITVGLLLARHYAITLRAEADRRTIAELLRKRYHGAITVTDAMIQAVMDGLAENRRGELWVTALTPASPTAGSAAPPWRTPSA